jgi:hypothetical protein
VTSVVLLDAEIEKAVFLSRSFGKYLHNMSLIIGLASIICFVMGNFFASQIMTTVGSQALTTSTVMTTTTLTTHDYTATFACTGSPCTVDVDITALAGVTEFITGTVTHVIPTVQTQATENARAFLNALGTIFLLVAITLQICRWKARRK